MDFISIIIVLGVVFVCTVLLLPFYIFRKKDGSVPGTKEPETISVPLWRSVLLVGLEGLLFLVCLAYFVLQTEGVAPSYLGWIAAVSAGGVAALHVKNRRIGITIRKSNGSFLRWTLVAYEKVSAKSGL